MKKLIAWRDLQSFKRIQSIPVAQIEEESTKVVVVIVVIAVELLDKLTPAEVAISVFHILQIKLADSQQKDRWNCYQ